MQSFNVAQTFYIDPGVVANSPQCAISSIDLFFQAKPTRDNNASGQLNPGVSLFICETIYGVPKIENKQYPIARVEYDQVATTSDASMPTKFRFSTPVIVQTAAEYAIVIMYDGSDHFQLWSSKTGDFLIDTKKISPGPSGKFVGKYYDYVNSPQNFDVNGNISAATSSDQYKSMWTPLNDIDIKFRVYAARYSHNGFPVSSNTSIPSNVQVTHSPVQVDHSANNLVYIFPSSSLEILIFSQSVSVKEKFVGGQWAYQDTFSYPGGYYSNSSSIKVSVNGSDRVTANSNYPNGAAFSWRDIYPTVGLQAVPDDVPYIVLKDTNEVDVRRIVSIPSNTVLIVEEPVTFTNAAAEFMVTPVARVDSFNKSSPFGEFESIVILTDSAANSTVRFVNNTVTDTTVVAGGTGYSNSDVFYVIGYEDVPGKVSGGYNGVANVKTDANGTILDLYFSNAGCGFVDSAEYTYVITAGANTAPATNTSSGTGANVSLTIGSSVKTELRNNHFANCRVANFPLSDMTPFFDIDHPPGTSYDIRMRANYYAEFDESVWSEQAYYVGSNTAELTIPVNMFQKNQFQMNKVPTFVSRSNEFVIKYANGASNDTTSPGRWSNVVVMSVNTTANSDYACLSINSIPSMSLSAYIVNDDYSNEHTDQGNAWARQITTKISFARSAEDLVTYLTAYKPAGTDIQVYARFYNSADPEYFEDKDWTLLGQDFTANLISSSTNPDDWVELTYSPGAYPNVDFRANGTITCTNAQSNVIGVGTSFDTDFAAGDLIKITNPLFAQTYMIEVVNSVTNATHLVLNNPVTNSNFATYGMAADRIRTYKHQAFNNFLTSNVVRYYNSSMVPYDGYDTYQVKVVMLAQRPNLVPRVDDIRAIGVSA